jgi:hypothetical protein
MDGVAHPRGSCSSVNPVTEPTWLFIQDGQERGPSLRAPCSASSRRASAAGSRLREGAQSEWTFAQDVEPFGSLYRSQAPSDDGGVWQASGITATMIHKVDDWEYGLHL